MSGGSFDYVCYKVGGDKVFEALPDVRGIEEYLRSRNQHAEADEVLRYIREVETHQRRLGVIGERIAPLLKAVEWEASGDSGMDQVNAAYFKLMGMTPPGD